jgi:hypothetical protein
VAYVLITYSLEFGSAEFRYDTMEELKDGFGRLVSKELELNDGADRTYRVIPAV